VDGEHLTGGGVRGGVDGVDILQSTADEDGDEEDELLLAEVVSSSIGGLDCEYFFDGTGIVLSPQLSKRDNPI
jgi:hypothetical protein